jgi:diguanylate cyclase (GGDEF)-like protein
MGIENGKVLLVDDSATIRAVVGQHLKTAGYDAALVDTGMDALEWLDAEHADAVLLDVNLPDIGGFEVCRRIKADPSTYHIPVIVLTSLDDAESELAAIEAGADDFITKPPNPRILAARLKMHIMRSRRERCSNALTGLPGNVLIEQEFSDRFASGIPFCLAYADLDDFKSYNDHFGYQRGDAVILLAGSILCSALDALGTEGDFVGHIGGDDFVVLTVPERMAAIAERITRAFDEAIPAYYDEATRQRGSFDAVDRRGNPYTVPMMGISVVSVDNADFNSSLEMVDVITELKHEAKQSPGSVYIAERRHATRRTPDATEPVRLTASENTPG